MDLILIIILCFLFGFGIGFMILDFIFSKREKKLKLEKKSLISEIEKLNRDIKHLTNRIKFYTCSSDEDIRQFTIRENYKSFDVILKIIKIVPYGKETVLIKRFYFKDDFEYAKLCAQELLDALNNTN